MFEKDYFGVSSEEKLSLKVAWMIARLSHQRMLGLSRVQVKKLVDAEKERIAERTS
jgi:hypothetical protein